MSPILAPLVPLFLAVTVLMAGNGLATTLVPLRATIEGFSPQSVGLIGSSYFAGMLMGAWTTPAIVARAGHIRAFAAYAAIAAVAALAFAMHVHPAAWMAFRLVMGFCFAGLFTIIDSWINHKATNANRGQLLALSNVVNFSGSAIGQQLLRLDDPRAFTLFSGVAQLYMLALVPMALTKQDPPPIPKKARLDIGALYRTSPIGVVGMVLIGLANATFWMLAPAYIERLGLGPGVVATFMTAMIVGSAVGPYPIGRLADRVDRRRIIVAVSCAAAVVELVLALAAPTGLWLYVLAFLLGICLPVLYPLVSAHANDRSGRDGFVAISSTLLFLYCVGGIVGPTAAAFLMATLGDRVLFLWNATVHVAIAAFVVVRMLRRAAPEERVVSTTEADEARRKGVV
jgi:MFS family permease